MRPVVVREDDISRSWLARRPLAVARSLVERWGLGTALVLVVTVFVLYWNAVPARSWPLFLVLLGLPLTAATVLVMTYLVTYPLVKLLPAKRWSISSWGIEGGGFSRRLPWSSIRKWSFEEISEHPGYYCFRLRWSRGIWQGDETIVIPPSVELDDLREAMADLGDIQDSLAAGG